VEVGEGGVRLGAMTSIHTLEADAGIRAALPTLAQAAAAVGPLQIRNMGTIGGNLTHNALGADPPPALLALDARATVRGPGGVREVPMEEFFTGYFETCVAPDELVTEFRIPRPPSGSRGAYLKFSSRAVDMAIVGIAVLLVREGKAIAEARLAVGGAAPVPFRARRAEAALRGAALTESALLEAGRLAAAEAAPLSDVHASADYRRWLVRVLVPRAVAAAAGTKERRNGR
jgi:carbon-monoxide dehydrogenase medium subunit